MLRFPRVGGFLGINATEVSPQAERFQHSCSRRTVTIPDHEPVLTDVFAASGGYVWLRGFSTSEEVTWTRHSLRGDPVVQFALSRRDVIKDAAHDWLWIVRRGEFDVPRLVKLKVGGGAVSSPAPQVSHEESWAGRTAMPGERDTPGTGGRE